MKLAAMFNRNKWMKYVLVAAVLFAPFIFLIVLLKPLVTHKTKSDILKNYRLSPEMSGDGLLSMIARTKEDPAYGFYFYALPENEMADGIAAAVKSLQENRSQESLREVIQKKKQLVNSLGVSFMYLNIPADNPQYISQHPEILQAVYGFLREEFELTTLGICYKSTYDPAFYFTWDKTIQSAAQKLRTVIFELKKNEARR